MTCRIVQILEPVKGPVGAASEEWLSRRSRFVAKMPFLHTLRTARALRVVALLGYVLVVLTAGVAPWMAPAAYGSVCSAAGNNAAGDDGITCALCLPPAAPPQNQAPASLAHAADDTWLSFTNHTLLNARPAVTPPARAPPAV
jgi:hypothetical protein